MAHGRSRRSVGLTLLSGTALVVLALTFPAMADGGAGGIDNLTGAGGNGSAGTAGSGTVGGGGGGAGVGAGGAGGAAASALGGAGGAGGVHGFVGAVSPGAASSGTNGTAGQDILINGASGGGGGAGGYGAIVSGSGLLSVLGFTVTGGTGGDTLSFGRGGNGGSGGVGLLFTNSGGTTIVIDAAVAGGAGGAGGNAGIGGSNGSAGAGGAGIVGQNLSIIMGAIGTVAGGGSANAITFTGSVNSLAFDDATPGLTGNIAVTGSLEFAQTGVNVTVANAITGTGSVSKTGVGTIIYLTGANTYTGATTITEGAFSAGANNTFSAASAFTVETDGVLFSDFNQTVASLAGAGRTELLGLGTLTTGVNNISTIYSGQILGGGALSKTGTGTMTLSGVNAYAGGTTINEGAIAISADSNLGSAMSGLTFAGSVGPNPGASTGVNAILKTMATFSSARNVVLNNFGGRLETDVGTTLTLSGQITSGGGASLIKQGGGTLVLTGNSSIGHVGRTFVNGGTLRIEAGGKLGASNAATGYVNNGATVIVTGSGSTWQSGVQIRVGDEGSGTLRIENGGRVDSVGASAGLVGVGGNSSVMITGALSAWYANGARVYVGHFFSGALTVQDGGTLQVGGGGGILQAGLSAGGAGGAITIGAAEGDAAAASGILDLGEVQLVATASRLLLNHTNAGYTFNPLISGAGDLLQLAGTTTLNHAANAYTGGTRVEGGTLRAETSGAFVGNTAYTVNGGSLDLNSFALVMSSLTGTGGTVALGSAALTVDQSATTTFAGVISGTGSLIKAGTGMLTLSGTNTFSGSLSLSGGILVAMSSDALGDGSATNTLAIGGGTLRAGANIVSPAARNVNTTGPGNIDTNGFDVAIGGVVGGAGGISKAGAGMLALTGMNGYLGATAVNAGKLVVNGSIASSSGLTIAAGAEVGGTGILPATTVNGILAPGNSIGTVTVSGALTFAPGSTYAVEVSPTDADRTNVVAGLGGPGNAVLSGATVATTYAVGGGYIQRQYTIVNAAGGLGGTTFAGLAGTAPAGFSHRLTYDGNNAYLALTLLVDPNTPTPPGPGNPLPFGSLNRNQQAVANTIAGFFDANGYLPAALAPAAPFDLSLMSGEISTTAISAGFDAADRFVQVLGDPELGGQSGAEGAEPLGYTSGKSARLGDRLTRSSAASRAALAALGGEPKTDAAGEALLSMTGTHSADAVDTVFTSWRGWGAAYGGAREIGGSAAAGSQDADIRNWGVAAGMDHRLGDGRVGFGHGGAGSSFSLANGLGSGNAGVFNAGLYGSQDFGNAYVSGVLAYGWHAMKTSRSVGGDTLSSRYNAHSLSGRLEAGYRFDMAATGITPYAAAQATGFYLPAYAETSASGANTFALAYGRQSRTAARTELGFRLDHTVPLENGRLVFSGRAAWAWNGGNAPVTTVAFQALPGGQPFAIQGATPARHSLLVDAGAEFALSNGVSAKLGFQGEFSRNVKAYGATAKLSVRW